MSSAGTSPDLLHSRLLAALDRLIQERFGSFNRAEQLTGVRKITLRQWRQGNRQPSLHRLLQTFDQLGLTLIDVIREAGLTPELRRHPSLELAAALPRQEPKDSLLAELLSRDGRSTPAWSPIPDTFRRLEPHLDHDPRVARVEFQDYLQRAKTHTDRATALCLWAMWLNSQGANTDAGLAARSALDLVKPACPLSHLLLVISASIAKNLFVFDLAKSHAEQAILGFLRAGDSENAARGLLTLGITLWATEEFDESERAYRDAVRLSPTSRFASMCRFNLVYNYLATDRAPEALRFIEANRDSFAAIPPAYALKMHWLSAKVLVASNRKSEAVAELKAALLSERTLSENPKIVFQMFFELAELLADAGRSSELVPMGRHLMPLAALSEDRDGPIAVSRAFLRTIQSKRIDSGRVKAFAQRFGAAASDRDSD